MKKIHYRWIESLLLDGTRSGLDPGNFVLLLLSGVRPCCYITVASQDFNLVSEGFWERCSGAFRSSFGASVSMIAQFGRKKIPYRLLKLAFHDAHASCTDWQASSFFAVDGTKFTGRSMKGMNLDGLESLLVEGIADIERYWLWKDSNFHLRLIPRTLKLNIPSLPGILHWAPVGLLFSESVVDELQSCKEPGITFMDHFVEVEGSTTL